MQHALENLAIHYGFNEFTLYFDRLHSNKTASMQSPDPCRLRPWHRSGSWNTRSSGQFKFPAMTPIQVAPLTRHLPNNSPQHRAHTYSARRATDRPTHKGAPSTIWYARCSLLYSTESTMPAGHPTFSIHAPISRNTLPIELKFTLQVVLQTRSAFAGRIGISSVTLHDCWADSYVGRINRHTALISPACRG